MKHVKVTTTMHVKVTTMKHVKAIIKIVKRNATVKSQMLAKATITKDVKRRLKVAKRKHKDAKATTINIKDAITNTATFDKLR